MNENEIFEDLTREQALAYVAAETVRNYEEDETSVKFIAFVPIQSDFCRCEWTKKEEGWTYLMRMLPNNERLPEEEIQDERIVQLALAGKRIDAIRLFRGKYDADLAQAVSAVAEMTKAHGD